MKRTIFCPVNEKATKNAHIKRALGGLDKKKRKGGHLKAVPLQY